MDEGFTVINYWDILLSHASDDWQNCTYGTREHKLVYVLSGEIEMNDMGTVTLISKGECAFIRKDKRLVTSKRLMDGERYKAIYLIFKRDLLRRYYNLLDRKTLPTVLTRGELNVYKMPDRPDLTSLFLSLMPYFDTTQKPTEEWAKLKLYEGLMALLQTDKRFYPCLFDFTEQWKIDILDFLNKNYMYDLSLEEMASYTARSLSAFKRDFAKISDLSPEKWLIHRRLEAAHEKLEDKKSKISDVCFDVGFKNLSHFSKAYKEKYGFAPSK
jgi:AraC-like DNA-binding protein